MVEINWSIIPQGIPANVCSAFWQTRAFDFGSHWMGNMASRRVNVATSDAAELERPPPTGTVVARTISNPDTLPISEKIIHAL